MKRIYSFLAVAVFTLPLSLTAQDNRTWKGSVSNQWDMITSNWMNPASPLPLPTAFLTGSNVLFDDTATEGTIEVVGEIKTGDVKFNNATLNYVLKPASAESKLTGTGALIKESSGDLTISVLNQLSGGTIVKEGTIIRNAGADADCFGSGVSLEGGAIRFGTTVNTDTKNFTLSTPVNIPEGQSGTIFANRYTNLTGKFTGSGDLKIISAGERVIFKTTSDISEFTGDLTVECSSAYNIADKFLAFETTEAWDWEAKTGANEMFKNRTVNLVSGGSLAHGTSGTVYTVLGKINAEDETCVLYGYLKSSDKPISYYEMGHLNDDAVFKGTIRPFATSENLPRPDNSVGLVKVGTGTYTLTSGLNFITKGIDIQEGKIFVSNPENGRSGTGTPKTGDVVTVQENGALGGTGRISGHVTVYGKLEPGENGIGTLSIIDLKTRMDTITVSKPKVFDLKFRETAVAEMELGSSADGGYDRVIVDSVFCAGKLEVKLASTYDLKAGDEYRIFVSDKIGGEFSSIELPNSETWTWDTSSLYVNGTIKLVTGGGSDVGIKDNEAANVSIKVYPNPTSGRFEVDAQDNTIVSIQVISIGGLLVHNQSPMSSSAIVELSSVAAGAYIVKVQTTDALSVQKIIVKK